MTNMKQKRKAVDATEIVGKVLRNATGITGREKKEDIIKMLEKWS